MDTTRALYSLASSSTRPVGAGSVDGLGLHPQGRAGPGHARADAGPDLAADDRGLLSAGQPADLLEDGDGADGRVAAVEAGHDEDLAIDAGRSIDSRLDLRLVEPDGNHHAGQQHRVGERKHRQLQRLCHNQPNAYTVERIPAFNHVHRRANRPRRRQAGRASPLDDLRAGQCRHQRPGQRQLRAAQPAADDHRRRVRHRGVDQQRPVVGQAERGDPAVLHARQRHGVVHRRERRLARVQPPPHQAVDVGTRGGEHQAGRVPDHLAAATRDDDTVRGAVHRRAVRGAERRGVGQRRVDLGDADLRGVRRVESLERRGDRGREQVRAVESRLGTQGPEDGPADHQR